MDAAIFTLSEQSDDYMIDNLSITDHAFTWHMSFSRLDFAAEVCETVE